MRHLRAGVLYFALVTGIEPIATVIACALLCIFLCIFIF